MSVFRTLTKNPRRSLLGKFQYAAAVSFHILFLLLEDIVNMRTAIPEHSNCSWLTDSLTWEVLKHMAANSKSEQLNDLMEKTGRNQTFWSSRLGRLHLLLRTAAGRRREASGAIATQATAAGAKAAADRPSAAAKHQHHHPDHQHRHQDSHHPTTYLVPQRSKPTADLPTDLQLDHF